MADADSSATPAPALTPAATPRYCRGCSYDLRGSLESKRCPECGRGFDPGNPRSTRRSPRKSGWRWVARAGMLLLAVALLVGGTWGWFWWDWRREQQALEALGVPAWAHTTHPIGPEWLHARLGRAGYVLKRVGVLQISGDITDLTPLANLRELTELWLTDTPVSDLTPLANLTGLRTLYLLGTHVSDVSPLENLNGLTALDLGLTPVSDLTSLANLTGLTELYLSGTQVADVAPLANVTGLTELHLSGTQVADVSPLANLTELRRLWLDGTQVSDVSPLMKLTALRELSLPASTVTEEQANELRRALPECLILRH